MRKKQESVIESLVFALCFSCLTSLNTPVSYNKQELFNSKDMVSNVSRLEKKVCEDKKGVREKGDIRRLNLVNVRGVYLHAWKVRNKSGLNELISEMRKTGLNTFVVDIKSNAGEVLYKTNNSLASEIGSKYNALGKLEVFVKNLHEQGIYVIARQVVFHDPILATKKPELGIHDQHGNLWKGELRHSYSPWTDPYSEKVQEYNLFIMEEACKAGVDEIQFDYIRFPAQKDLVYPNSRQDISKPQVLIDFLRKARSIAKRYDVKIGIDIFGFSIFNRGDLGIGHSFSTLLPYVDVISPMLYPSHYTNGNLGIANPAENPYKVILLSVKKANELAESQGTIVRPWVQAFGWNTPNYSAKYIADEIIGVYDGGSTTYLVWNANTNYAYLFEAMEIVELSKASSPIQKQRYVIRSKDVKN